MNKYEFTFNPVYDSFGSWKMIVFSSIRSINPHTSSEHLSNEAFPVPASPLPLPSVDDSFNAALFIPVVFVFSSLENNFGLSLHSSPPRVNNFLAMCMRESMLFRQNTPDCYVQNGALGLKNNNNKKIKKQTK